MCDILLSEVQEKLRRDAGVDKRETCACVYAGARTHSHMFAEVDWPCHFISRYFILMW